MRNSVLYSLQRDLDRVRLRRLRVLALPEGLVITWLSGLTMVDRAFTIVHIMASTPPAPARS
jgi:hypothetical protein